MSSSKASYDVFISHAIDGDFKSALALPLQQMFASQEISAFVDEADLSEAKNTGQNVTATVHSCKVFVALIDCHYYLQSDYRMRELRRALGHEDCQVVPIFLSSLYEYPITAEASKKVVDDSLFESIFKDWSREEYVETVQEVLERTGLRVYEDKTFELAHLVVSVQNLLVSGKCLRLEALMKNPETAKRIKEVKAATVKLGFTSVFRRLHPIQRCKVGRLDNKAVNLHHESYENLKRSLIIDGKSASVVGVRGAGGVGKTWLAVRLGNDQDVINHFSDGILFSTFGEEEKTSIEALRRLWTDLGGHDEEKDKLNLSNARSHFERLLAPRNPRTLLILDDIWDERYLLVFKDVVHDHSAVKLLVTSRQETDIKAAFREDCAIYPIQPRLTRKEALEVMRAFSLRKSMGIDEEAMLRAAALVDFHPKALSVASAQARLSQTWQDFADVLEEDFAEVPEMEAVVNKVKDAIWRTFKKRFHGDQIAEERFLRLGAFVKDGYFTQEDLQHVWRNINPTATNGEVAAFLECSLIERAPNSEGVFYVHGLVRQRAREEKAELTRKNDAEFTALMRDIVRSRKQDVTQYMFDCFEKHAGECDEAWELRDAYKDAVSKRSKFREAWSCNRILAQRASSKGFYKVELASLALRRNVEFLQSVLGHHEQLR